MYFRSLAAIAALFLSTPAAAQEQQRLARNGDVTLSYWVHGDADGPPIIIINGQGVAARPEEDGLAKALTAEGFRVIQFDNRDAGQSSVVEGSTLPYDLSDMADDTLAVLDAAGVERTHVFGHSLGGMIAQVLAATHPERVISLISASSTSGEPGLPYGPAMEAMGEPPEDPSAPMTEQLAHFYRIFEGKSYHMSDSEIAARVAADMAVQDPGAAERQAAAVAATGDRRELLGKIEVASLVLHGSSDPWFPLVHAERTAAALSHSRLEIVEGMGHILSDSAAPEVAARVAGFICTLTWPAEPDQTATSGAAATSRSLRLRPSPGNSGARLPSR